MGTVCVALLVALGAMGGSYGLWSEILEISGTVETGTYGANITYCGGCTPSAIISCDIVDSDTLGVTVADTAEVGTNYYCDFDVRNSGTIPLKIHSIVVDPVDPSPLPTGVSVWTTGVVVDTPIEPGGVKGGTVYVSLTGDVSQFTFTVTFNVIPWNQ